MSAQSLNAHNVPEGPPPEDPTDKKGLTIRIHLLCDGTNNNRENIAAREAFEAQNDPTAYRKHGNGADTSYDNGRTNIAVMEPHIEAGLGVGDYSITVKVYVQGQGTFKAKGDSGFWGIGMAVGPSGVYQRAREGINEALDMIQEELFLKNPPEDFFIKQVDVDVFGFSRGAATARHAIHAMTTEETMVVTDPDGSDAEIVVITHPLFQRFRQLGYTEMHKGKVTIKFAGLYDTVVSVFASQLLPRWLANNTRDQQAVKEAEFTLHLAAADEHRSDFPLHTIKSALDAKKGAEYYLPGVHSDIGGSYNLANESLLKDKKENATIRQVKAVGSKRHCKKEREKLLNKYEKKQGVIHEREKDIDRNLKSDDLTIEKAADHWFFPDTYRLIAKREIEGFEYVRTTSEVDRVINRGLISDLEVDMGNLIKDGWYNNENEKLQIVIEPDVVATVGRAVVKSAVAVVETAATGHSSHLLNGVSIKSGQLVVNRIGITSGYCNIPLKIMVKYSREYQILIDEKLNERANIIINSEPELVALQTDITTYMDGQGKTGSKPEHWTDLNTATKHHKNITEVRNKHMHMSCRFSTPIMDAGFTPRFEGHLRRRFYYEG